MSTSNLRSVDRECIPAIAPGPPGTGNPLDVKIPADGAVSVSPLGDGRYLVQIGRPRYVKRLQLSHAEAAELHAAIGATVPGIAPAAP